MKSNWSSETGPAQHTFTTFSPPIKSKLHFPPHLNPHNLTIDVNSRI